MSKAFNGLAYIKEILEQRRYLLDLATNLTKLLGPNDDTRKKFETWSAEHRVPEFKSDEDFDDLVYNIFREAQKAYRVEDIVITMKDRFDGFSDSDFDADTLGDILARFETALGKSDAYYEAYWETLDETLDDACLDRCDSCEYCSENDAFICTEKGKNILDLLECPIGNTLRRTIASIENQNEEEN